MGTHGATDLPNDAEEWILPQYLHEHQLRVYGAFQRPSQGDAEGVMCAISAFAIAGDVPPPRNNLTSGVRPWIPNCVNTFLLNETLRTAFNSSCFIQSDCCDSITAIVHHQWVPTLKEAVADAVNAGLSASYGDPSGITAALTNALADGSISETVFAERIQRTLLTLFRVGVFDTSNPNNPFRGPFDESVLDGAEHRALAREAAARTAVLLENRNGALPLQALPAKVAIIGPFSHCTVLHGDYGGHDSDSPFQCSYGHSYSGTMSKVSTVLTAAEEEAAAAQATVRYAQGSGIRTANSSGLSDAIAAAQWADLVILSVGLGSLIEVEGRDRTYLTLPTAQQDLVDAVAQAVGPSTRLIITIASAGGVDLSVPRADAVLQVFYAGEEAGHGLFDVLLGRVNPSARMPLTVHTNSYLDIAAPLANFNMIANGVGRTYRYFNDSTYILYRFGYGLSYCTFTYSQLSLAADSSGGGVTVSVSVEVNTSAAGQACREVTQVYLRLPTSAAVNTPIYSLVGFESTVLPPKGSGPTRLAFHVLLDDLLTTYADGSRSLAHGTYTFFVSGHLPDDAAGLRQSNSLVGSIVL